MVGNNKDNIINGGPGNNNSALLSPFTNRVHQQYHDHRDINQNNNNNNNKEQDHLLPIANVGRVMKQILPANAKVSKEARERMQECASEFVSFVTGEAADRCRRERRRTLNGDDICWALQALGFNDYVTPLRRYLQRYRDMEGDRAAHARGLRTSAAAAGTTMSRNGGGSGGGEEGGLDPRDNLDGSYEQQR